MSRDVTEEDITYKDERLKYTDCLKYAKCCHNCHIFVDNYDEEQTGTCLNEDITVSAFAVCEHFSYDPIIIGKLNIEICYPDAKI